LHPGPGFGGSCFPKDVLALAKMGENYGSRMRIVESVVEVNKIQKELLVRKIEASLDGLKNRCIGVLGLSFKPNTDDIRESPAILICQKLIESHAQVQAYDPISMPNAQRVLNENRISYCTSAYEAAANSDALLVATEWNEFRNIDLEKIKSLMRRPIVFDARNIFEPEKMESLGFKYFGTGR
jgi:UDPglucose 6-dehydrogenase